MKRLALMATLVPTLVHAKGTSAGGGFGAVVILMLLLVGAVTFLSRMKLWAAGNPNGARRLRIGLLWTLWAAALLGLWALKHRR